MLLVGCSIARKPDDADKLLTLERSKEATIIALLKSRGSLGEVRLDFGERTESGRMFMKCTQAHGTVCLGIGGSEYTYTNWTDVLQRLLNNTTLSNLLISRVYILVL